MRNGTIMLGIALLFALACASMPLVEGRYKDLNNLSPSDKAKLQHVLDSLDQDDEEEGEGDEGEGAYAGADVKAQAGDDEEEGEGDEEGEDEDEDEGEGEDGSDDDDDEVPQDACDHCLRVDYFDLGRSCSCMFDCCRPFHYDEPDVAKLPLACQHYYYDTEQWKTCDDPCSYCTKTEYLGFKGQNMCFHSCCSVELDEVQDDDTFLSYRVSSSCHDWQMALTAQT